MSRKAPRFLLLLIATIAVLHTVPAKADETWEFLQVTCVPELNYFSLHTVEVSRDNFIKDPKDLIAKLERLRAEERMLDPQAVLKLPFTCSLREYSAAHIPAYSFTVKIVDYVPASTDGRGCVLPSFNVSLELNGKEIRRFSAFEGPCTPGVTHTIEADAFSIRDCTLPIYKEREPSCERKKLWP